MIFGIKTKKDKKIEELQNQLKELYHENFSLNQNRLIEQEKQVIELNSIIELTPKDAKSTSDYRIREQLTRNLFREISDNIEVIVNQDNYMRNLIYKGTIRMVVDK